MSMKHDAVNVRGQFFGCDATEPPEENLLKPEEVARRIRVSTATLAIWRSSGRYALAYCKVGRLVYYKRKDVEAWLETRTRSNGATA